MYVRVCTTYVQFSSETVRGQKEENRTESVVTKYFFRPPVLSSVVDSSRSRRREKMFGGRGGTVERCKEDGRVRTREMWCYSFTLLVESLEDTGT